MALSRTAASLLGILLLSFTKGSPRQSLRVFREQLAGKGMGKVCRLVAVQVFIHPAAKHPTAHSLRRIEELALATVSDQDVALANKLGIAAVDHDCKVEDRLARVASVSVFDISDMFDGST